MSEVRRRRLRKEEEGGGEWWCVVVVMRLQGIRPSPLSIGFESVSNFNSQFLHDNYLLTFKPIALLT